MRVGATRNVSVARQMVLTVALGAAMGWLASASAVLAEAAQPSVIDIGTPVLSFDGVDDFVVIDDVYEFGAEDAFTVSIVFRADEHVNREPDIVGKRRNSANSWAISDYIASNGELRVEFNGDENLRERAVVEGLSPGQWHEVHMVYGDRRIRVYVDGALRAEQAYTDEGDFDNAEPIMLGRRPGDGSRLFHGEVSRLRIWDRALSGSELRATMDKRLEGDEAGLVGYWRPEGSQGDRAHDSSPSENHGTIHNTGWRVQDAPAVAARGENVPFTVQVQDDEGRLMTEGAYDIAVSASAGRVEPATVTIGEGESSAELSWSHDEAGTHTLTLEHENLASREHAVRVGIVDALSDESSTVRDQGWDALRRVGPEAFVAKLDAADQTRVFSLLHDLLESEGAEGRDSRRAAVGFEASALLLAEAEARGDAEAEQLLRATDWPQRRYNAARSGATPHELPEELHLNWVLELPEPRRAWPEQADDHGKVGFDISYEPVVAAGLMFVPSMVTDSVTAYDVETGERQWRYYTDGPVRLAPAFSDGRLYFGSDDGYLYCVDAESGELAWRFQAAPSDRTVLGNERVVSMWSVRGAPVIDDGIVYFAAGVWPVEGVYLYAVEADSGEVVWKNSGVGQMMLDAYGNRSYSFGTVAPQGSLAVSGDRLIVPGGRTTPAYYDLHTGELIEYEMGKRGGGYGVSASGLLPVRQSRIRAGSQEYDSETWSEKVEGTAWRLLAARNRLFVVTEEGRIYCFGPEEREPTMHAHQLQPLSAADDGVWADRAEQMLEETGATAGYAVMYGIGSGELLEQLLTRSELHIVAFDPDAAKVAELRERFADAGLYGSRVAVHQGNALSRPLPPYVAELIVSEDIEAAGAEGGEPFARAVFHPMRPYGGAAYLFGGQEAQAGFAEAVAAADLEQAELRRSEEAVMLTRPGALPGSGTWSHQYASAANTTYSDDTRVRAPLGISWFGGENNHRTLPRHMNGPIPQVVEGRLVILGVDHLTARCVYTGRRIWSIELPMVGEGFTSLAHEERFEQGQRVYFPSYYGANFRGSPYVTTSDSVYIVHQDRCLRIDLDTGETLAEFELPDREELSRQAGGEANRPGQSYTAGIHEQELDRRWGHLSTSGDYLIVAAYPHMFDEEPPIAGDTNHVRVNTDELWHWNATSSEYLLALDRRSGEIQWVHQARYGFRHNAIATDAGRTFVIDNVSEHIRETMGRRGIEPDFDSVIHALDLSTGEKVWSYEEDVFGTWLAYSNVHDVLFQGGRAGGRSTPPDEPRDRMVALRGEDGEELWTRNERHTGPAALHEGLGWIIGGQNRNSVDLLTGELIDREHPITGAPDRWRYIATKGCGTQNVSRHLVNFRSGAAAYYDLYNESGTGNLAGFRSGCTNNLVVADGVLNAPENTRSCSCAYQHQTSLAFVHMPETEMWTYNTYGDPDPGTIRRVGINFGAPGNRVDDSGLMWLNEPPVERVPAPTVPIEFAAEEEAYFADHSMTITEANGGHRWVAASGVKAPQSVRVGGLFNNAGNGGEASTYTVRLHFTEPEDLAAGDRVFDVRVQGEKVLEDFDIVAETGGRNRVFVAEVAGVSVGDGGDIEVSFHAGADSAEPPVVSGIDVQVEQE